MITRLFGKLMPRSVYDVFAALALFITLTGGTAMALSGSNTVYSDDIVNGQVKAVDLAQPKWQEVQPGSADSDACATQVATFCSEYFSPKEGVPDAWHPWENFGDGFETAGFLKDGFGFVHLKGLVKGGSGLSENIFVLPQGFRPTNRVVLTSIGNGGGWYDPKDLIARIDVTPEGVVSVDQDCRFTQTNGQQTDIDCTSGGDAYLSLNGLEFRTS